VTVSQGFNSVPFLVISKDKQDVRLSFAELLFTFFKCTISKEKETQNNGARNFPIHSFFL
jgi:hypothetical protein